MEAQILRPVNNAINIQGKILYSQGDRSWNMIRIRKDILDEFPQLREKQAKFSYRMILHKSNNELEKAIRALKRDGGAMPILLFLCREKITPQEIRSAI